MESIDATNRGDIGMTIPILALIDNGEFGRIGMAFKIVCIWDGIGWMGLDAGIDGEHWEWRRWEPILLFKTAYLKLTVSYVISPRLHLVLKASVPSE
jgi:hypothetical protein